MFMLVFRSISAVQENRATFCNQQIRENHVVFSSNQVKVIWFTRFYFPRFSRIVILLQGLIALLYFFATVVLHIIIPQPLQALFVSLQALNEEFQKYRTKLEMLDEMTYYLIESEKDDPTLVAEIRQKFSDVEEPFERLHSNVLQRQARLQNIVIQGQDFQLSLSDAQNQLNEFERDIAQLQAISAIYEVVQQQKEDHEVREMIDF